MKSSSIFTFTFVLAIAGGFGIVSGQDLSQCGTTGSNLSDYRCNIATTITGRTCQRWNTKSPHQHTRNEDYPNSGLENNYCRNPDSVPYKPWCYTTDEKKRWEYCAIPECAEVQSSSTCFPTTTPSSSPTTTPLDVKWGIHEPLLYVDGLSMSINYSINSNIDRSQMFYEVYDKNCKDGGVILTTGFNKGVIEDDDTISSVPVSVDLATITDPSVPEGVYTEIKNENGNLVQIEFCIYFGLKLEDGSMTINWLEAVVSVTYSLYTGLAVGAELTTKERDSNRSSKDYDVEAYICQPGTDTPTDLTTNARAFSQGSLITICVKPTADSIADGLQMVSIESYEWVRDETTQAAIESYVVAGNLLTTFDDTACVGADYCQFSSILFAAFFSSAGSVVGRGVASMEFKDTSRRLMDDGEEQRRRHRQRALQRATSDFDLSVSVTSEYDRYILSAGTLLDPKNAFILGLVSTATAVVF